MTYLRNGWYCAGWSQHLGEQPQQRLFLGEPIVLFRRADGKVVALGDRCPHRFAPLHQGRVKGERIECPYHGLQFGADGRCQYNPHGDGTIPKAAAVRAYPIVEQQGALWIWMGDAALADPAKILDIGVFDSPADYTTVVGHMLVRGHYQLVIDNLLDLTHAAYLHVDTLGAAPEKMLAPESFKFDFREEAWMVEARNRHLDSAEHSAMIERDMRRAFEQEDEPMIRACQDLMGTSALFDLKPVLLPTDAAAVRARRLLDQLIHQEQRRSET